MASLLAVGGAALAGMVGDEIIDWLWPGEGEVTDILGNVVQDLLQLGPGIPFIDLVDPDRGKILPPDTDGHGVVVKTWQIEWESAKSAGVNAFVLTDQGWIGARRKNMTWSWHKPKKPIVIVPGKPISGKVARKVAKIYASEKKDAKKLFGLVDKKAPSRGYRARRHPSGDGSIVIVDND